MLEGRKVIINTRNDFEAVPADKYIVEILDVNLKTQLKYQSTEEEEVLEYQFGILDENPMPSGEGVTRGRYLWRRVTLSLGDRSILCKLVSAVYGKQLTQNEKESFNPESLIGMQVAVVVDCVPGKKDNTIFFNNITNFLPVTKKLEPLSVAAPVNKVVKQATKSVVKNNAPDAEAANFIEEIENSAAPKDDAKAELEAAELELAALEARAKAARAKAAAMKA